MEENKGSNTELLHKIIDTSKAINHLLLSETSSLSLAQKTCEILVNTRGYLFSWIVLFDEKQNINQFAGAGNPDYIASVKESLLSGKFPSAFLDAKEKQEFKLLENFPSDSPLEIDTTSWTPFIAPILIDNFLHGILCGATAKNEAGFNDEKLAITDITNNIGLVLAKLYEQKGRKNNESRLINLINSLNDALFIIQNKKLVFANLMLCELSGLTKEELLGHDFSQFIAFEEFERIQKLRTQRIKGELAERSYESVVKNKSGQLLPVGVTVMEIEFDGRPAFQVTLRDVSGYKKALKKLQTSRQQLNNLLGNLPGVAYNCKNNPKWDMNFLSEGCFKLLGYQPEELLSQGTVSYIELIHPDDRQYVWENIQHAVEQKESFELEYRIITRQNKEKWVWERGNAVPGDKDILIEGFISDITPIKMYEEQLLEKNKQLKIEKDKANEERQKYRELFTNSASVMLIIDPENGKIIDANQAACNFYKYSRKAMLNLNINDINTLSEQVIREEMENVITNRKNYFHFKHRLADGYIKNVEVHSSSVQIGGKQLLFSIIHDITLRKELESRNTLLSKAIEASPVSIVVTDVDGNIEYANPYFERKSGYRLEEIKGQTPRILKSGEHSEAFYRKIWETILNGHTWYGELHNKKKSGELFWEQASISPIFDEHGKIEHYIAAKEDVTAMKLTLQELERAKNKAEESDRLKSSFLANMSHEIRTPMNGIIGFTNLLQETEISSQQHQEFVNIIKKSGHRMLNTINDIIDISKIESGLVEVKDENIDLSTFVKNIYSFFTPMMEQNKINFLLDENNGQPVSKFLTDSNKLNSILTNLIKNAFKFTPEGTVKLGYTRGKDSLTFYVTDTGIGIPKERQKDVFERFVQADIANSKVFEGSGLGLAITKSYTEMLGGTISLESEPGKGTTFFVQFPLKVQEQPTIQNKEKTNINKEKIMKKTLKILIAEDDPVSVQLLRIYLRNTATEFIETSNGPDSVEAAKENPDIDLILMDIRMPQMDGLTATRKIRKFNPDVKIVAQTAFALPEDHEKALDAGCDDFITKPISREKLFEIIEALFNN